jgi:hypothetical protein
MRTIFVDLATSDVWNFRTGASDDEQPHMVRIAWVLVGNGGEAEEENCHLIKLPAGERMDGQAAFTQGIFDQHLTERGMSIPAVLDEFLQHLDKAGLIVGFNWQFRRKVIESCCRRLQKHTPVWPRTGCAMIDAVQVVKIPRQQPGGGFKFPTFDQARQHFLGRVRLLGNDPVQEGIMRVREVQGIWERLSARTPQAVVEPAVRR